MNGSAVWQLEGDEARLSCGPLQGRVEADGRGARLVVDAWQGQPSDAFGALITAGPGPRPPVMEIAERFVRGDDYVVAYAKSRDFRLAPHFYWRATFHEAVTAVQVEMIMSVQTDLLDSYPEASVGSFGLECRLFTAIALRADSFQELASAGPVTSIDRSASREHLFVYRNEMLGLSYAQMVHPSDFVSAEVHSNARGPWLVTATLFPEHLEKGVIRRGRISGWFMPAGNDLTTAATLAQQFVDEPLPLTA